jgi:hypothetical protein
MKKKPRKRGPEALTDQLYKLDTLPATAPRVRKSVENEKRRLKG